MLTIIVNGFMRGLALAFTPENAFLFAIAIVVFAIVICFFQWRRLNKLDRALDLVNAAMAPVRNAEGDDAARIAFRENYQAVSRAVRDGGDERLSRGWAEFEESIVDLQADVLKNSVRPEEYFHHLSDRSRGLLWWANISVAVGLVLTFLGIMAALSSTARAIADTHNTGATQEALKQLLGVTAAKFLTSAAGVFASIGLRAFDVYLQKGARDRLHIFTDALERGLVYLPPQRIAADQLASLRQIEVAQTKFATELATAIGEKFNEQITPMISVLGDINGSILGLKSEMTEGLSKSVGESISASAGKEMQALAGALTQMSEGLSAVPGRLSATSDDANSRIEAAAQLFSQASAGMSAAFDALGRKIEEMGDAVVEKQRSAFDGFAHQVRDATTAYGDAANGNAAAVASAGTEMRALIEQVGGTLAAINGQLAAQAEAGANSVRNTVEEAQTVMASASRDAGVALSEAAGKVGDTLGTINALLAAQAEAGAISVRTSVEEAQTIMASATRDAGAALSEAAGKVGDTLGTINAQLAEQAMAGASAVRTTVEEARTTMAEATRNAGAALSEAAEQGALRATEASIGALENAFGSFTARFEVAGRGLTDRIDTSATKVQAFGGSLERVAANADAQAEKLATAGLAAERLGGQLSDAAQSSTALLGKAAASLVSAAEPVQRTVDAMADGIEDVVEAVEAQRKTVEELISSWRMMAAQFEATANAAQNAWQAYSERFEGVDQSLASALTQVSQAASEGAKQINDYARKVDENLANAVNRLAGVVDELADLPDAIEQAVKFTKAT